MNSEPILTSRRSVLKSIALGASVCATGGVGSAANALLATNKKLARVSPESLGIDSAGILAFIEAAEQKVGGLHSFMLLRHGKVAAEGWWAPYAPQHPHMLYSLSKSFTSTAVGFAVTENRISVDTPVLAVFPDEAPSVKSPQLEGMLIRHLLTMSTGHDKDATGPVTASPDGNWVKTFLSLPIQHEPGTHFVYNSAATYMLSAIVQKVTGLTVLDYLKPRLFDPLGIVSPTWEMCPRGINKGGWGLNVKTEDIARFGQCYLQKGQWEGQQVIPEKWIAEATTKQISNGTGDTSDWAQGYCYQFWRCRHGAFRGDGAFGQFCVVMPEQDAVLAITSGVGDMQAVLNVAWDHLLPAMQASPLPSKDSSALKRKISSLAISAPSGAASSPKASDVSHSTYRFASNERKIEEIAFSFEGGECTVDIKDDKGWRKLSAGSNAWVKGNALIADQPNAKFAAKGAWADPDTYTMKLCFYEGPYIQTMNCAFSGSQVKVDFKQNVTFGPAQSQTLVGSKLVGNKREYSGADVQEGHP